MKTIKLHGILAKRFGQFFKLDVQTAREATHAIACQNAEFKRFMLESDKLGLKFAVFLGRKNISANDIDNITDTDVIHIVPRIVGSGGNAFNWLQVVAGAVLVGVGAFTFGATTATGAALIGAGIGMFVGGVAGLFMPTVDMSNQDPDGNKANKGFGSAVTTVSQGNPVPILYGEREIGGFYASGGIYAEDAM
nr:tail assembly protein [Moraxella sp. CTOTU48268]